MKLIKSKQMEGLKSIGKKMKKKREVEYWEEYIREGNFEVVKYKKRKQENMENLKYRGEKKGKQWKR